MREIPARFALRARLVFPISSPPIDGGVVTIDHARITAVGRNMADGPIFDLGNVALLPGFVNPHAHLEFSAFPRPLGRPGMRFPDWIETLVNRRRQETDQEEGALSTGRRPEALQRGVRECLKGGTTTVANTTTWDVTEQMLPAHAPRYREFRELIGLSQPRVAEQREIAWDYLTRPSSSRIKRGLSPHAPYTAAPELVRQAVRFSKENNVNIAMHLAESPEELELLAAGEGPFRELLQRLGAWDPSVFAKEKTPGDYLPMLKEAHRCLIIHGNFLASDDWAFLARHTDSMSTVYCPRTHHYFRYPDYPLSRMLDAGVRVVLGTDGRASNPDLDSFREFQFAAERHGDVRLENLLRMVTLDAAAALGEAAGIGSLEPGKVADLVILELARTPSGKQDPYTAVIDGNAKVSGVYLNGVKQ